MSAAATPNDLEKVNSLRGLATGRLRVFYDADCPLCDREIRWLRSRVPSGDVDFQNLGDPDFDPSGLGLTHAEMMRRIYAQLPDGRLVTGPDVFRELYRAAGLGWLLAPTTWPGLRQLTDAAYEIFARNRLRWTGREACESGTCAID